jgi:virulence factor
LFIHPLDYSITLFGSAEVLSVSVNKNYAGRTLQLHLRHKNGVTGLLDCSTQYSWNSSYERMQINCPNQNLELQYPTLATAHLKPSRILNLPAERILNQPVVTKQYFSANNFILPVAELNTIYLQGFLNELESFISIAEQGKKGVIANDLPGLLNLYSIFDTIRANKNY